MPEVPINTLAVLACGIASMIIGSLWYGPLFGKKWLALSGMSQDEIDVMKAGGKSGMWKSYLLMFVGSLVMAYVLAHSIFFASEYLGVEGVNAGLQGGFWSWLGFVAPVTLGSVLWDRKPWMLWVINNGYNLVTLLVMGVILALWM